MNENESIRNQCCASVLMSTTVLCFGCVVGWLSPVLPALLSNDSPLGKTLEENEVALLASVVCVGAMVGTFIFGAVADKLGRKVAGLACSVPMIICWIVKLSTHNLNIILVARFIAGAGGAGSMLVSILYAAEVSSPRCRGSLGSVNVLAFNVGILCAYSVGGYISYNAFQWTMLVLPVGYFLAFLWMPESPRFLVKAGNDNAALKSLAWLRGMPVNSDIIKELLCAVKYDQTLIDNTKASGASLKDSILSPVTLKAFALCFTLVNVQGFIGMFAIMSYATVIFGEVDSSLSANSSAIILASIQLAGSFASTVMIERIGRKVLFAVSAAIVSVALVVLGTYFFLKEMDLEMSGMRLVPLGALSVAVLVFAMGVGPVPYVLTSEVFMVQVSGIAASLIILWLWLTSFLVAQFFGPIVSLIGIYGAFWGFASVSLFGLIFTMAFLPETKGKSLDEILELIWEGYNKRDIVDRFIENESVY